MKCPRKLVRLLPRTDGLRVSTSSTGVETEVCQMGWPCPDHRGSAVRPLGNLLAVPDTLVPASPGRSFLGPRRGQSGCLWPLLTPSHTVEAQALPPCSADLHRGTQPHAVVLPAPRRSVLRRDTGWATGESGQCSLDKHGWAEAWTLGKLWKEEQGIHCSDPTKTPKHRFALPPGGP